MGHHSDGLWRCDDSPVISNGGTDESREDPQCDGDPQSWLGRMTAPEVQMSRKHYGSQ